jgi:hypothetical protein
MIFESRALRDILIVTTDSEKLKKFEISQKSSLKTVVYNLAKNIGHLRLANKKYSLGLSFKPARPEGPRLKIGKFICDKTFTFLGNEILINTVVEYSKNRGENVASREEVLIRLNKVLEESHEITEIINGHDVAEILSIISKNGVGSTSKLTKDAESVEETLALSFDLSEFSKTRLYQKIKEWETLEDIEIFEKY